jgi:aryl-alcohol dehydrogenase-like predicted oxidoreductase
VQGHATPEGTRDYAKMHPASKGHYRSALGLTVSSLGIGTYLGEATSDARHSYQASILTALKGGVNVVDTASNYRDQASERDVGAALRVFVETGGHREHVVVSSKAGFLHGDCDQKDSDSWFRHEYIDTEILGDDDLGAGHTLSPRYIRHELMRSRHNLGLDTLDVYYVHNPEHQLGFVAEAPFYARLQEAFEFLETAVDAGQIRCYGVATWDGLRTPAGAPGHLALVKLIHHAGQARMRVGGKASDHHLRAVQLPVNFLMTEAALEPTQAFRFGAQTLLDCARELGLFVMASASLLQMRAAGQIPAEYAQALQTADDAQTAMQFTRSVPGVTTALVGMGQPAHAKANAAFVTGKGPDEATVRTLLGTGSVHGW